MEIINKRTVGYIRVSTEEQSQEGISLENQEVKIRTYVDLNGLDLIDVIRDPGVSGKNLTRAGIQSLIELCENKEIDHLIVYKLDRLTRKTRDLLYLVEDIFNKNDVEFHSLQEHIDTTTAMGKFFLTLMGALAQMERDLISERTKDALRYKKEKGEFIGSPPLGFQVNGKGLERDKREMEIIKTIKEHSSLTLQEVADLLNEKGYKGKRGGIFYPSTIAYIRKNGAYR